MAAVKVVFYFSARRVASRLQWRELLQPLAVAFSMTSHLFLPTRGSFPGCQLHHEPDGKCLLDISRLWSTFHSERSNAQSSAQKLSTYLSELQVRMHHLHKVLYPSDTEDMTSLKPLWYDNPVPGSIIGSGLNFHSVMSFFWWGFGGWREKRERTRKWENRLAAGLVFRDFVGLFLEKCPHAIRFQIPWGGVLRSCTLQHGILDMRPLGEWRELPALELLNYRWQQQAQARGLRFLVSSPYQAPVADLLVGGAMLSDSVKHADLCKMLFSIHAQLGNLLLYLLPRVTTSDPCVLSRRPFEHIDKALIGAWVDQLFRERHSSLPVLLRSLQVGGVCQLRSRIYKDFVCKVQMVL